MIPASGSGLPIELDLEERLHSAKKRQRAGASRSCTAPLFPTYGLASPSDRFETCWPRPRAECDWILVIGRRSPQSGMLGRLHDLSYAMARDAPSPVLSVW